MTFRSLSIPKKIVAIIMTISGAALLLASSALIAYDLTVTRQELGAVATVFAHVVADNTTAAVSFNDPSAALDTLQSLRAESSIVASCIYTPSGLFAQYAVADAEPCPAHQPAHKAHEGIVLASAPIELNGKNIGTVQIHATLAPVYTQLRLKVAIIGTILIISALFAFALSSQLHKFVSQPILTLANTAHEVSRFKDYSIRATKENDDELGALVDAFNEMLAQIQQRQRDLQERTAELVQASRIKDEFLATLSHELRTPLNSILGWAVLMRQDALPKGHEQTAMDAIERNARVQARLIEDLLDVSRIVSGKLTLESSSVALQHIVESAIDVVRPAADAKHIVIQFDRGATPLHVAGDPARLQQAVWNLLSNAVKFTGETGYVVVRLERLDQRAHVSISDNGIGISSEFLPYVFDRFRQADSSSTRKHGGLGLGLALVRYIVEMHGGSVRAESPGNGMGSTFTITLPLLSSAEVDREPIKDEQFRPGRVL